MVSHEPEHLVKPGTGRIRRSPHDPAARVRVRHRFDADLGIEHRVIGDDAEGARRSQVFVHVAGVNRSEPQCFHIVARAGNHRRAGHKIQRVRRLAGHPACHRCRRHDGGEDRRRDSRRRGQIVRPRHMVDIEQQQTGGVGRIRPDLPRKAAAQVVLGSQQSARPLHRIRPVRGHPSEFGRHGLGTDPPSSLGVVRADVERRL